MPKIIVFLGPSLDQASAAKILAAEYRPPAKRGDILAAVADGADIIGLIDGVFHQDCAVAHREILVAVKAGITVVGASSMGALRAAEMDTLGMTGIGRIYHMYKDGTITSDDEVALVFDPVSGYALSEPLINIRCTLKKQRRPASSPQRPTLPCLMPHARSSTRSAPTRRLWLLPGTPLTRRQKNASWLLPPPPRPTRNGRMRSRRWN